MRVGEASVAAGIAGLTAISLYAWMVHSGPADAAARAQTGLSVFGTIHPPLLSYGSAAPNADLPQAPRVRVASLETTSDSRSVAAATDDDAPATTGTISSFNDRFFFDGSTPLSALRPSSSFDERFGAATPSRSLAVAAVPPAVGPAPAPNVAPPAGRARLATVVPLPRPAPHSLAQGAPGRPAAPYRVASLSETPVPAAYAPADAATKEPAKDAGPLSGDLSHTAIYDISAHTVYLPSGERLEAHSGLGSYMDDVHAVNLRKQGPTPPNVYDLSLRENLFHGVRAIRLNPVEGSKMFGRDGMLVHPFMLGPEGASNGCVSIKDYPAFLKAYQRGEITRLVVVEQLDDPASARTAADWISNTLKRLFGPS